MARIDRNSICARLEVIVDSLGLPERDWLSIARDDDALIAFAAEHGQSLDWIVLGDVRGLIRRAAHG